MITEQKQSWIVFYLPLNLPNFKSTSSVLIFFNSTAFKGSRGLRGFTSYLQVIYKSAVSSLRSFSETANIFSTLTLIFITPHTYYTAKFFPVKIKKLRIYLRGEDAHVDCRNQRRSEDRSE